MTQAIRTIDHEEIREWVEAHGGQPAVVEGTYDGFGSGILRIDWGIQDEALDEVSWEDFFRVFDDNDLAFLYQENDGGLDTFSCRFVARTEEGVEDTGGGDNELYGDSDHGLGGLDDVSDAL